MRGFTAKVSDFGLSRLLPEHSPKLGSKAEYTGTVTHMAPELLQHGQMSRAADVYSFGILSESHSSLFTTPAIRLPKLWEATHDGKKQLVKVFFPEDLVLLISQRIAVWEALMGEAAYMGINKMQVMFGVVSEGLRPEFPVNTPPWYAQIASACWKQDAKRRQDFEISSSDLRAVCCKLCCG